MNPSFLTLFLMITWSACEAQTPPSKPEVIPKDVTPESNSHSHRKSVTTTSDGKTTVKRTVTVVNGIETVVTETTDENGNISRKESGNAPTKESSRPWIGLRVREVSKILRDQLDLSENEGLVVELVADDSPSDRSGIKIGDLLLALGQQSVSTSEELSKELLSRKVGDKTKATIMRKGKRTILDIELSEHPMKKGVKAPKSLREGFGDNSVKSVDLSVDGAGIDSVLDNPNLPESFKESVRAMRKTLREFEKLEKNEKGGKKRTTKESPRTPQGK